LRPQAADFCWNDAARDELARIAWRRESPRTIAKEQMHAEQDLCHCRCCRRHRRTDRGAGADRDHDRRRARPARDRLIVNDDVEGIAVDQRPAFREYIVRERVPNYTIPDRVVIGGVLPETGVTYYDVPQTYGATPYRYTVVNGRTVLVEPRSRRIVQVVE
jgi:hypothetical protein